MAHSSPAFFRWKIFSDLCHLHHFRFSWSGTGQAWRYKEYDHCFHWAWDKHTVLQFNCCLFIIHHSTLRVWLLISGYNCTAYPRNHCEFIVSLLQDSLFWLPVLFCTWWAYGPVSFIDLIPPILVTFAPFNGSIWQNRQGQSQFSRTNLSNS